MNKELIRKDILSKRTSMTREDLLSRSSEIAKNLLSTSFYNEARTVMAYVDFRNEVQTEEIIKVSLSSDKRIALPISIISTKELLLSELFDYDEELTPGAYGILEPKKEFIREVDPKVIDLVLIPGVAFDRRGYRVGYGAGYYDRFLKKLRYNVPKVALAFDIQLIENAYPDSHDIPVDYIVTEMEIIKCK